MTERHVDIEPIFLENHSRNEQQKIARRVLELVRNDFQRLGLDTREATSIADPDSEENIATQIERMITAKERDVIYGGIYTDFSDPEFYGIVKVGSWTRHDAKAFGTKEVLRAQMDELVLNQSVRPRGLHVFSVEPDIITPSLTAIYMDDRFLPMNASLRAAIHESDVELHDAFSELGAQEDGPTARIKLGRHMAKYTLRTIPAMSKG